MNINIIINNLKEFLNLKLKILVFLGRNKYEYYEGLIDKMYDNIFTIKTETGIKSFSYSDIATKTIVISKFN